VAALLCEVLNVDRVNGERERTIGEIGALACSRIKCVVPPKVSEAKVDSQITHRYCERDASNADLVGHRIAATNFYGQCKSDSSAGVLWFVGL
jgi:hypothetical protein